MAQSFLFPSLPTSLGMTGVVDLDEAGLVILPRLFHLLLPPVGGRFMRTELKNFLKRWAISTIAVLVATKIVPGINYDRWDDLLIATLVLGILNIVLRPLLMLLSLPLLILTLGLFTLVINAALLFFVNLLLPGFHVRAFWDALLGALIISIVTLFLNAVTGSGNARVEVHRGRRPPGGPKDGGDGPVIDV